MTDRQRELAEFFARLATIPAPAEQMTFEEARRFEQRLRKEANKARGPTMAWLRACAKYEEKMSGFDQFSKQKLQSLVREFERVSSYVRHQLVEIEQEDRTQRGKLLLKTQATKLASQLDLPRLHRKVREALRMLFGGVEVPLAWLYQDDPHGQPTVHLRLDSGRLAERVSAAEAPERLLGDFVTLLRLKPFPFGLCPQCETVFVRVKRQRYCSRACAARFIEAARKGKRREYMRDLMAKRRERARRLKQKGH